MGGAPGAGWRGPRSRRVVRGGGPGALRHARPAAAARRLGARPGQKNLLLRVVLRDLEKTLTNEAANTLRDRIYLAIHQGAEHQWAGRR